MKLILDNNILFSIMNPSSIASYLFSSINSDFLAPEFIKHELEKYKEECLIKSKLSEEQFEIRRTEVEESIQFIELSEYEEFLDKAVNNLSDPKDSSYLALALSINAAIWSNDEHFKEQSLVPVLTTKDLLAKFLNTEI
jgi:predicted nucleic acid-binding protein